MRLGRTIWKTAVVLLAAGLLAALLLYIQASRIPGEYRPAQLSADQKNQAVKEFWSKVQDFGNDAQGHLPYEWSVSEEQLNRYLASADEIASSTPSGVPGRVYRELDDAHLAAPAVHLGQGTVTLMVRSQEYQKILSAEIGLAIADGKLAARMGDARVGCLALPPSWVKRRLEEVKRMLPRGGRTDLRQAGLSGLSAQDVAAVIARVLEAVDENPISAEITWPVNRKRVRIDSVEIRDGRLMVRVTPIDRQVGRR